MNVLSLFSGAEGIGLGLEAAGMTVIGQCEIEPAAIRILAHHWPHVPRWSDVRKVTVEDVLTRVGRPDVVVGGFPCQDLSVAGQRAGMAGERSGLYRELLRLTRGLNPDWLVVENVPGLLSASADPDGGAPAGSAMGLFLGDLTGFFPPIPDGGWRNSGVIVGPLGSAAWRVLDARHFGVAQRRRRVFVVFHPRDRAAPGAVLLEPEGLQRHPSPRVPSWARSPGMAGSGFAGDGDTVGTLAGTSGGWRLGADEAAAGQIVPLAAVESGPGYWLNAQAAGPLRHRDYKDGPSTLLGPTHALTAEGADASEDGTGRGTPLVPMSLAVHQDFATGHDIAMPVNGSHGQPGTVAVPIDLRNALRSTGNGAGIQGDGIRQDGDPAGTITGHSLARPAVAIHENQRGEITTNDTAGALNSGGGKPGQGYPAVALALRGREDGAQLEVGNDGDPYNALRAGDGGSSRQSLIGLPATAAVRRLTPLECERLMGWPDHHTAPAGSDSARYKACGNGVVANVTEWIACRILDYTETAA